MTCCSDARVSEAMTVEGDEIVSRVTAFVKLLRDNSFPIGIRELEDATRLLGSDVGARPDHLRQAFKALFSGSRSEWSKFDALFDAFWLGRGVKHTVRISAQSNAPRGTSLRDRSSTANQESARQVSVIRPPLTKTASRTATARVWARWKVLRAWLILPPPTFARSSTRRPWQRPIAWRSDLRAAYARVSRDANERQGAANALI